MPQIAGALPHQIIKKTNVRLTPAEHIVNQKILEGKSNQQIADELGVSINTIKTHVAKILKKEHVKNRIQLISNQVTK